MAKTSPRTTAKTARARTAKPANTKVSTAGDAAPVSRAEKRRHANRQAAKERKEALAYMRDRVRGAAARRKHPSGKPGSKVVSQEMARAVRKMDALELKIKGLTWRQVGQQMGLSHVYARELAMEAAGEIALQLTPQTVDRYRHIESERLDEAHRAVVPLLHGSVDTLRTKTGRSIPNDPIKVAQLQLNAARTVTHVSGRRSRLYGLDAPQKIALTDQTGRPYAEMTDEELEALLERRETEVLSRAKPVGFSSTTPTNGNGRGGNGHG